MPDPHERGGQENVEYRAGCCFKPYHHAHYSAQSSPERGGASVEVIDALKRKHWREEFPYGSGAGCHWCDEIWPCQTVTLLTTIERLQADIAQARAEVERLNGVMLTPAS